MIGVAKSLVTGFLTWPQSSRGLLNRLWNAQVNDTRERRELPAACLHPCSSVIHGPVVIREHLPHGLNAFRPLYAEVYYLLRGFRLLPVAGKHVLPCDLVSPIDVQQDYLLFPVLSL